MWHCPQGVHAFLRAYYHYKSADWKGNNPFRLNSLTAEELAKMPTYYIMDLDRGMAETVASVMPTPAEIAACKWLPDNELAVLVQSMSGRDFRGAFRVIGVRGLDLPRTCKRTQGARSTCPRYSLAVRAIGAFSRIPAHSSGCKEPPVRRCAAPILLMEPDIGLSRSSRMKSAGSWSNFLRVQPKSLRVFVDQEIIASG